MRRLIFILMIALLPLRGWAGEAMATQMAISSAKSNAINLIANNSINTPTTEINDIKTPDCEMHASVHKSGAAQAVPAATSSSTTNIDTSHSCNHCQACHAVGLTTVELNQASYSAVNALPQVQIKLFASADLALRQKPPIL